MKRLISFSVIFVICFNLTFFDVVYADERDSLKSQISDTQNKIEEEKEKLSEITQEKSETQKQVEQLSTQINDFETQIEELESKISQLNIEISNSQAEIEKKEQEYIDTQDLLDKRLVSSYQKGPLSYLDILFSAKSFTEIVDKYYLVNQLVIADNELMEEITKTKEAIQIEKENLENNKAELDSAKSQKEEKSAQLVAAKNTKTKYIDQLTESEKETQAKIDQLEEDNKAINAQLKAAEQAYAAKIAELNRQQELANKTSNTSSGSSSSSSSGSSSSSSSSSSSGSGIFIQPVSGPVTARMYYSSGRYHGAVDYGIPVGTPVKAAADGVVLSCQHLTTSYGSFIVIQHANGLRTWYAHGNGTFYVSPGESVKQGQVIMLSGNSGNSEGPHLHFEVRVSPYNYNYNGGDSRRDPFDYF